MKPSQTVLACIVLSWLLLSLVSCSMSKDKAVAEKAVTKFHQQLDDEHYQEIYAQTTSEFKNVSKEDEFTEILQAVHRKLGKVKKTEPGGWRVNYINSGTVVILEHQTEFEQGRGVETFTWRISGGEAQMLGYNINSPTLITK